VRVALDTNILVYAEGVNGRERMRQARSALVDLSGDDIVIPVQALAELFTVLTRKAGWTADDARRAVMGWHDAYAVADTSPSVLLEAMELVVHHRFSVWDAIMLAAAAQADCRFLLSEDLHAGFAWRGITVRNPFATGSPTPA
jgi:predicted nucleic acid-binding protein